MDSHRYNQRQNIFLDEGKEEQDMTFNITSLNQRGVYTAEFTFAGSSDCLDATKTVKIKVE